MSEMIRVSLLQSHPMNPRRDLGELDELTDSVRENGILQNLTVVRNEDDSFTVIIGHRRLAAAKAIGIEYVPCNVVTMDEQTQVATMLLENMQRKDLTPYEQAKGVQQCLDLGLSVDDISKKTGLKKKQIKHRVKMLELDENKLQASQGTIDDYIALEEIEDIDKRNEALEHIGTNNFNLEVAKAKVTTSEDDVSVSSDLNTETADLYKKLRVDFMTDVFRRKIEKEELAQTVLRSIELQVDNKFKVSANDSIFNEITNPNNLVGDEFFIKISKHRVNFFVISVYNNLECFGNSQNLYDFIKEFGYKPSDEEQAYLDGFGKQQAYLSSLGNEVN